MEQKACPGWTVSVGTEGMSLTDSFSGTEGMSLMDSFSGTEGMSLMDSFSGTEGMSVSVMQGWW